MKLLLTGDSIVARHEGLDEPMLDAKLRQKISGIELNNTAVSGINSGAFFVCLNDLVLKQKPCDKLFILLGTNDLATHKQVPLKQFKQNMSLIASAVICQYRPNNVYLISPPAVDENKQHVRDNDLVSRYVQVIKEVAKEYHFNYVGLFEAMIEQGNLTSLCQGMKNDGLHFGKAGYELFSDLIVRALK